MLDPTDVYAMHIATREWNCKSQMGYLLAENEGDRDMEEAFQNLVPVPSQTIQCLLGHIVKFLEGLPTGKETTASFQEDIMC